MRSLSAEMLYARVLKYLTIGLADESRYGRTGKNSRFRDIAS